MTLDGTALSHDLYMHALFEGPPVLSKTVVHTLRLLPCPSYGVQPGAMLADFVFGVSAQGEVVLDPRFGGVASASGSTLVVRGVEVTLDGTALSHDLYLHALFEGPPVLSKTVVHTLRLLPCAGYAVIDLGGAPHFAMSIDTSGNLRPA